MDENSLFQLLRAEGFVNAYVWQDDPDALASLLAIEYSPSPGGGGTIDLVLCGGGLIRLSVECIDGVLTDLSEPRPAVARPVHNLEA